MRNVSILSIGISGLLILLGLVFIIVHVRLKKSDHEPKTKYRSLFVPGIIFMGAGISLAVSIDSPGIYGFIALSFIIWLRELGIAISGRTKRSISKILGELSVFLNRNGTKLV